MPQLKRILLVCSAHDPEFSNWTYHEMPRYLQRKAFMAPLHLATVAALTPPDIEVRIWDEPVHGLIDEETDLGGDYDLVGVTAFSSHLRRARNIARVLKQRGYRVAIGGPGVSAAPATCRDDFDILFVGETELIWPQFIEEYRAGTYSTEYRATTLPELSASPKPRWDSIAQDLAGAYVVGGLQVTRGCPFNCEFCGVWQTFGRRMRTKPIGQVIDEVQQLHRFGVESILYCSDNFVGNSRYAKEVLRAVTPVNNSFERPISFSTELDITIGRDPELLELLADANFSGFLIGLETPSPESLKEIRKRQNLRTNLVDECLNIQSYGVPIDGSMIVGFDHDTTDIFDRQFEFIQEACIPIPRMHMLKAIAGTELRTRLMSEGRVLNMDLLYGGSTSDYLDAQMYTNILPKSMSRQELHLGYLSLIERVFDWTNFEDRMKRWVSNVRRQPRVQTEDPGMGLFNYLRTLAMSFPQNVQESITHILDHTERQAPFMSRTVATLVFRHILESGRVPVIRADTMRQVEHEEEQGAPTALTVGALAD